MNGVYISTIDNLHVLFAIHVGSFAGQGGWHFCEHAASGECGFVPGWVFDDSR